MVERLQDRGIQSLNEGTGGFCGVLASVEEAEITANVLEAIEGLRDILGKRFSGRELLITMAKLLLLLDGESVCDYWLSSFRDGGTV